MKIKRLLSLLLCAALLLTLAPAVALAADAEMQNGLPTFDVNTDSATVVGFGGRQWVVIGYDGSGVASTSGTLTLLLAGSETPTTTAFNSSIMINDYAGSTLQSVLDAQFAALGDGEKAVISGRTLTGGGSDSDPDKIAGSDVSDAKFWPLSYNEANTVNSSLRDTGWDWWLRSPGYVNSIAVVVNYNGSLNLGYGAPVNIWNIPARPAFLLNLSSVLFTSAASGASAKSSATAGSGLVGATATTNAVKFTMQSTSQALAVNATTMQSTQSGSTLMFSYANATTGANQFVSCVLTDGTDEVKYYGKLADSSSAASGSLSIPLSGVADGTYTLKIFSEQANGDNYTDFCSAPVTMTVTVSGGTGIVSSFSGTVFSDNAGLSTVAGQTVTATGTGTSASPMTASISVPNRKTFISTSDIVAATGASVSLYSDSDFINENQIVSLNVGANNLYVKVTAEDGTICYYKITVTVSDNPCGTDGADGADGRNIELQAGATYIQWRYAGEGDNAWRNLVALSAITGSPGSDGADGSYRQSIADDGVGVASIAFNDSGELVFTLTDGTEINLGAIVPASGASVSTSEAAPSQSGASGAAVPIALGAAALLSAQLWWLLPLLKKIIAARR